MNLRVILLYPFTIIYSLITALRNHLFNIEYSRSFNYDIMTINVGNLSVGGTGKTPMVEYLIKLLQPTYAIATLSRGYKRKSEGFIIANSSSTANDIGDEPFQFHSKFKDVTVAVGENRALAIPRILMEHPETQVVLLDDAYQHRSVSPDFNILLTQFNAPFYQDYVLPSGYLRESRSGAKRANAIIITKCPSNLTADAKEEICTQVERYAANNTPIFFTFIEYGMPTAFKIGYKFTGKVILFAGLANMDHLTEYITNSFELVKVVSFKDHHDYTQQEINVLVKEAQQNNAQLITTEKDMAKIRSNNLFDKVEKTELFYLPISVQFLFNQAKEFDSVIKNAIIDKYEQEEIPESE